MNAGSWRSLILTLVLAIAAGFAGARIGMIGEHRAAGPAPTYASVRQAVDALLDRDFKLTPAQRQQIVAIDARFSRVHNQIWAGIYTENARLANAVAADMSLNTEAKAAIQGIQEGVGRLHSESILYVLQVRQVLTPAQRPDFDDRVIMALMRSPP